MKFKHSDPSQAFELKNSKFGKSMRAFSKIFWQQTITTTKMTEATTYSFEVNIASFDVISTRILHGLMLKTAMKYKLRSKLKIQSKLILMHVM